MCDRLWPCRDSWAAHMRHRGEIFRLSRDLKVVFDYVSAAPVIDSCFIPAGGSRRSAVNVENPHQFI